MTTVIGMTDLASTDGYIMYLDPNKLTHKQMVDLDNAVDDWLMENNLVITADFLFTGVCSIVMDSLRNFQAICPHGIRFMDPENETAFRLRFLCK